MATNTEAVKAQLAQARTPVMNARAIGNILFEKFYQYTIAYTFPLGSENFQNNIQIQSDAHFLIMSTAYTNSAEVGVSAAGIGVPYLRIANGGALIQLSDGGNDRFLSFAQVPLNTLFGSPEFPHVWEFTHLIRANTPLNINITGMGAVAPFAGQVIRLVFTGMKVPLSHAQQIGIV